MRTRLAYGLISVAALLAPGLLIAAERPLADNFRTEPPESLVRQLRKAGATVPEGEKLAVSQQHRWLPQLGLMQIDTSLTNRGTESQASAKGLVLSWDFCVADGADAIRYRPLAYRNDTWYGSTYWTGPDWTRVGKDWHHPGINTPSVRRFTAPRDGRVTIRGTQVLSRSDGPNRVQGASVQLN